MKEPDFWGTTNFYFYLIVYSHKQLTHEEFHYRNIIIDNHQFLPN
jgi:hypothetical protein